MLPTPQLNFKPGQMTRERGWRSDGGRQKEDGGRMEGGWREDGGRMERRLREQSQKRIFNKEQIYSLQWRSSKDFYSMREPTAEIQFHFFSRQNIINRLDKWSSKFVRILNQIQWNNIKEHKIILLKQVLKIKRSI